MTKSNEINQKLDAMLAMLTSMDTRISALEQKATVSKKSSSTKKSAASKTSTKSTGTFDRALYEATATKLGVFHNGKVCATVKDGKVLATSKTNRAKVYKAMGLK